MPMPIPVKAVTINPKIVVNMLVIPFPAEDTAGDKVAEASSDKPEYRAHGYTNCDSFKSITVSSEITFSSIS